MKLKTNSFAVILLITFYFVVLFPHQPGWCDDIEPLVSQLIRKYHLEKAKIGIKVISLADPEYPEFIYQKNSSLGLGLASNLKLFTTGTALCRLGPDFKYVTSLYRSGPVKNDVLKGNLVIKSNGDPNISGRFYQGDVTAVFQKWGTRLRALGIKKIQGNIIIDDTVFDRAYQPPGWPVDQTTWWYTAPVSAVSFNDNCVDITVYYDKETGSVKYQVDPPTQYVQIINQCEPVAKKSQHLIDFRRAPGTNTITINGKFWNGAAPYKESITIEQPGLYFGTVFKETLIHQKGIIVTGEVKLADAPADEKQLVLLASEESTLLQAIEVTNKRSQNFYAEQILKTLGYRFKGQGTFANGLEATRDFLVGEFKMPAGSYRMLDGSGLSSGSRFSADQIVDWLVYLARYKYAEQFRESLYRPGVDVSVNNNHRLAEFKGRLWVKTGYLKDVLALSGYFKDRENQVGVFSILINDFSDVAAAREFQSELVKLILNGASAKRQSR